MAAAPARPSTILDRYRVRRVVGAGSFGRVLEVVDLGTDERRALKIVPPGPHEGTLLAELEQLARLAHPSLPKVFDVGRTVQPIEMPGFDDLPAGSPFFVAEWIEGARCDERPLPDLGPALWALLADVASALATIHGAGIVHADVAPQNVLVDGARAVLVDLGLAASALRATDVRGTPAYMAPEALTGRLEPRSDLYGLGAIAIRVATGKPPFEAATLGELVQRIVTGGAARPLPGVPAPLADLIGRLVAREPDHRPASALAVLDELDAMAPVIAPASARRARPDVGPAPAPSTWPGAAAWIDELVASLARSRAIAIVVGDPGSGSRELVDAAVLRLQLDSVARQRAEVRAREITASSTAPSAAPSAERPRGLRTTTGTLEEVARELGVVQAAGRGVEADARSWLERVARALRAASAPVVLELGDDPRLAGLVAALDRSTGDRAIAIVVDRAPERLLPDDAASPLSLHPALVLDDDGVRGLAEAIVGTTLTPASTAALRAATGGRPAEVVELVRTLADELRTWPGELDWSTRTVGTAVERAAAALRGASPAARSLAAAVAAWGGHISTMRALETARVDADVGLAEVAELQRASLLRRRDDELALDRTALEAVEQVTGRDRIAAIADRELARLVEPAPAGPLERKPMHRVSLDRARTAPRPRELAALLELAPLDRSRAELACKVAGDLLATGRADRALALTRRAIAAAPASANLVAARAAAALGGYRDAIALATAATAAGADAVESELVAARAAQRAGELDGAESALAKLHAAHPAHPEVAGAYARLLVTRSRYADARRIATAGGPLAGLRAEAAGLAAFYVGDLDAADTAFAALETTAAATDDSPSVARALSLRGMVAQQRGQLGLASDRYREAARRLHDAGEVHGAAVAELNLGTILAERGRASDALPRLAAAGRVFAALAATTESIAADLNRGNALLAVGQADEARRAAEAALARAERVPHLRAFALLVAGDAHRRLDDEPTALRLYREALAIGRERRDAHAQLSAHVALAEAGQLDSQGVEVDALCASDDDRDRWTIARGRLALRHGAPPPHAWLELARACAQVAVRAEESDRLERAFRGHAVASRLAARGDDRALARNEAERARSIHGTWIGVTAPAFRAALDRDPDLADLDARIAAPTTIAQPHAEPLPLRRLLALSRRLNSEASVARILDEVIDTAIELSSAERGFLLLRQADGSLAPVVSRNFTAGDLDPASQASVSRSIAESAARTGEPVVTVDAGIDERFGAAASVAALRLRSVLAVPLRQRGTITGCIYVDHRLRGNAFDDAAVAILGELGDIAAIAIENARLADELRRTTAEVEALNARLAEDLAERDAELARVKSELPDRERLGGRYERIVGRSPAMLRMLEIVDRAAATALPVVIVGESGTGKELIAKALHDHGARRDGPFVAINCSAVPEPLLESELFGHVRGAFTGADRDRRGLFEVADGGTLFLDEIADTSMAMQAKLLRVLQDGMLRRVGDTRARKVDVRIVAASQQPLGVLVAAGRFREDLRFRIEVINVHAPPLRERDGDIPLLVEQLLARMTAGGPTPRITRAALRALTQHGWPGNVRELENALARGLAMGGDVIDLADLPESIAHVSAKPEPGKPATGEDLKLKPALLATEQAYIGAAMTRAKGNQTVAARLLGLSRFGLQKKLRRLSGADDDDSDD